MIGAKDGAWVSAERITHINCSKCGEVGTLWLPNEREVERAMHAHIQEAHG